MPKRAKLIAGFSTPSLLKLEYQDKMSGKNKRDQRFLLYVTSSIPPQILCDRVGNENQWRNVGPGPWGWQQSPGPAPQAGQVLTVQDDLGRPVELQPLQQLQQLRHRRQPHSPPPHQLPRDADPRLLQALDFP